MARKIIAPSRTAPPTQIPMMAPIERTGDLFPLDELRMLEELPLFLLDELLLFLLPLLELELLLLLLGEGAG